MAKINHNNFVDTINDIVLQAKQKEIIHLNFDAKQWNGNNLTINNRELVNFGTCGYLGLETHPKLIEKSIEYTKRYGAQFSISRAYVTSNQNLILEEQLSEIFGGNKTIVFSSTTLAHMAVLPILISGDDAIILDQQAHVSMQTAAQLMVSKGVPIGVIRHNNLEMLERKLLALKNKHKKIWYIIDGVYSMYGDLAPIQELNALAKKYSQLHFYVDDAHGMSWDGINGAGCVFEEFKKNEKTILVTTMAKGFGSIGGIIVFPNKDAYHRVNIHGGPLAYSHPIAPAIMGASMASAEIHLSNKITQLQDELKARIRYCNQLLAETEIPVLSNPKTPIYFIGTGQPNVGYNLNKRILEEGYYVNIGMFPAVSVKNTGLRFTITNHVSFSDIKNFIDVLKKHYPLAIQEEGKNINDIRKAFKLPVVKLPEKRVTNTGINSNQKLEFYTSILKVNKGEWDYYMANKAGCNWNNMLLIEQAFQNNEKSEENASFLYYIVREKPSNKVVCCTLFSSVLLKDDMFSPSEKSIKIEKERINNPYYLTSKSIIMGTLVTEGDHLYIDYDYSQWKESFNLILEHLYRFQEQEKINTVLLRDFDNVSNELSQLLFDVGYAKVDMPNANTILKLEMSSEEAFLATLSKSSKQNFKRYIKKNEQNFEVQVLASLNDIQLQLFIEMYHKIKDTNFAVNIFGYPNKLFRLMNENEYWEFIVLTRKSDGKIVSIGSAFKDQSTYTPVLLGLDHTTQSKEKVYQQMLYQAVKRASTLNCTRVNLGFTADAAKKDVGAVQISKKAYIQSKDNYNFEIIETISVN